MNQYTFQIKNTKSTITVNAPTVQLANKKLWQQLGHLNLKLKLTGVK